jgi:hypothetical protein
VLAHQFGGAGQVSSDGLVRSWLHAGDYSERSISKRLTSNHLPSIIVVAANQWQGEHHDRDT